MNLLIRTDATTRIGTGHLMRCLALAQAWQETGGIIQFVTATGTPALQRRLMTEGMSVLQIDVSPGSIDDVDQTIRLADKAGAEWIVVDGYHFDANYQKAVKKAGLKLLFIDDYGQVDYYYADLVLNQNHYANESLYPNREPFTHLLLGTSYTLLRKEFLSWCGWQRNIPPVASKVLVTLGGGDPNNQTLKVVRALKQVDVDGIEVTVVVGANNPHFQVLQAAVYNSHFTCRLLQNVSDMPKLMAWADVGVSGGGSTCWEMAFMGLPIIIITLAKNQCSIAECLDGLGVAVNLGWFKHLSYARIASLVTKLLMAAKQRSEMARQGRQLSDGKGVNRVLMHMTDQEFKLRRVCEEDCRLIWEWANDPEVRAVSFKSESIPWEQHVQWFNSKLNDTRCFFFIVMNNEELPIGQIRYEIEEDQAIISISLGREFRGKGYGSTVIRVASQKFFNVSNVDVIHSYVRQGNEDSARAFVKAGFKETGKTVVYEHQAIHLVLRKDAMI